ncbi:MAG: M20/M25/M40 family metallo-hydrolase [Planctomycetes bacterium]|nr:M20/M25/M40 family metallo-hydrolase [Planctomycetota bacterium]
MNSVQPFRIGLLNRWAVPALILFGVAVPLSVYGAVMRYSITADSFQRHINFLAADAQGGRGLGSEGIARSADYIAKHLASAGLDPAGDNGTFFQSFDVSLNPKRTGKCELTVTGTDVKPQVDTDFVPFEFSGEGKFDGDLVFAGYGIKSDEHNHNDFSKLDVAGKVVLMLRHEPPSWSGDEPGNTPHAMFSSKIYNAKDKGAVAVLIVNRLADDGADKLRQWGTGMGGRAPDYGLPAFHVSQKLAESFLKGGGADGLQTLQDRLDAGDTASMALSGVRVKGDSGVVRKRQPTRNVIGILKGRGPLAREIVVIGAHYDHLGKTVSRAFLHGSGDATEYVPEIHNGADDNASGTAGVLELARTLSAQQPLKRSVLFIAFSGEETGLLGSKHFVENPTVKLENIVAMLNMDMIGRLPVGKESIQVFGTEAAEGFGDMLERLAKKHEFELKGSASATGPSDHTSFYQKKIPSLHFFSGLHEDYHMPTDDSDKINTHKAVRFLAYIEDVAKTIIEGDQRPVYNFVAAPAQISGNRSRVRMGVMPSYADAAEGLGIDGVMADGPAAKAGMKDGDAIVRIAETKVKNIYDYMAALRDKNPGDEVEVEVLRDGKRHELKVILGGG